MLKCGRLPLMSRIFERLAGPVTGAHHVNHTICAINPARESFGQRDAADRLRLRLADRGRVINGVPERV